MYLILLTITVPFSKILKAGTLVGTTPLGPGSTVAGRRNKEKMKYMTRALTIKVLVIAKKDSNLVGWYRSCSRATCATS
jgi:hypothetical protein